MIAIKLQLNSMLPDFRLSQGFSGFGDVCKKRMRRLEGTQSRQTRAHFPTSTAMDWVRKFLEPFSCLSGVGYSEEMIRSMSSAGRGMEAVEGVDGVECDAEALSSESSEVVNCRRGLYGPDVISSLNINSVVITARAKAYMSQSHTFQEVAHGGQCEPVITTCQEYSYPFACKNTNYLLKGRRPLENFGNAPSARRRDSEDWQDTVDGNKAVASDSEGWGWSTHG
ncbi:hypothetical protein FB451DRAFT_1168152 [Mycena latifolia]|nr:hypothetical protein FB451DRAFT_1168152 [Mycena latifolia]